MGVAASVNPVPSGQNVAYENSTGAGVSNNPMASTNSQKAYLQHLNTSTEEEQESRYLGSGQRTMGCAASVNPVPSGQNEVDENSTGADASNNPMASTNSQKGGMDDDASTLNGNESVAQKALAKEIQRFRSIPEDQVREALALVGKYPPDSWKVFSHLVSIMRDLVTLDPEKPLSELNAIFDHSTVPREQLMDFLALVGGAEATVEIYAENLKSVAITDVTDKASEERHSTALCVYMLHGFWVHATDFSLEFAGRLIETGVLSDLAENLKKLDGKLQTHKNMFTKLLWIIHNCARNRQKRDHFRAISAVQLLTPLLASEDKGIKMKILLSLSYIIDEKDNHLLTAEASTFDLLLEAVRSAWTDENHRDPTGYKLDELLDGLGNLAQNDDNKKLLMEKDVVVLLKPILETGSDADKQRAANILWMLAFDQHSRNQMKGDRELMDCLEKLEVSSRRLSKACTGALWVLRMDSKVSEGKEGDSKNRSSEADRRGTGHIMISYQWANQNRLLQVRDSLLSSGFRVWVDVDQMSGSTLQAMAEAVEKADAVLVCMCQRYKDSLNCRSEAEYAYERQKPIIPLLMERNYKPDGWLGILIGSKLFFDFSGKYPYETKLEELVKELGERGRTDVSEVTRPVESAVHFGTQQQVLDWLRKHQLSGCRKLQRLSGKNIKFLQNLRRTAPEFFFTYLSQQLGLTSPNDLMNFCDAVDCLP